MLDYGDRPLLARWDRVNIYKQERMLRSQISIDSTLVGSIAPIGIHNVAIKSIRFSSNLSSVLKHSLKYISVRLEVMSEIPQLKQLNQNKIISFCDEAKDFAFSLEWCQLGAIGSRLNKAVRPTAFSGWIVNL